MTEKMTPRQVLMMIACNYFPFFHVLFCAISLAFTPGLTWKVVSFLFFLYLYPLICTRLALLIHPLRENRIRLFSVDYYVWWFTFCTQVIYLRFPALEEALRCVPALYSLWLRLWGSKVGKLVYWSAGTVVLERQFVNIGDHVCFGAGTRLNAHVQVGDELLLAPVVVEENVIVGGYSLLTAGTVLKANQSTTVKNGKIVPVCACDNMR
ncbi:MAG: hypothetical protein IJJ33_05165 [Victivallales bacterium]|nr:hypothetical protein [Victivallales bacterium]